jgi:hypothetical protein
VGLQERAEPEPRDDRRRPEPCWMTITDLAVIVAGVALVIAVPSRAAGWPPFLGPPPLLVLLVIGGLRLTRQAGLVLAMVILSRRGRYGGAIRPTEWLALGFASLALLEVVPNLDDAVNAYYSAVGSASLDFGVARWLLSSPADVGVVLVVACLVPLRRRARDGSPAASALAIIGIVGVLTLWFWGPCEVAGLELPNLLVPGLQGDPATWGWRAPVVFALRDAVGSAPFTFTWGLMVALAVRSWRAGRGREPTWAWTEMAASADTLVAALLLAVTAPPAPIDILGRVSFLAVIGLASWWLTGRAGVGRAPTARYLPPPVGTHKPSRDEVLRAHPVNHDSPLAPEGSQFGSGRSGSTGSQG